MDFALAGLGVFVQKLRVGCFEPEARNVDGDLEELFGGFAAGDAPVVVEEYGRCAQRACFDIGIARAEAHQRDTTFQSLAVHRLQVAASQVD